VNVTPHPVAREINYAEVIKSRIRVKILRETSGRQPTDLIDLIKGPWASSVCTRRPHRDVATAAARL